MRSRREEWEESKYDFEWSQEGEGADEIAETAREIDREYRQAILKALRYSEIVKNEDIERYWVFEICMVAAEAAHTGEMKSLGDRRLTQIARGVAATYRQRKLDLPFPIWPTISPDELRRERLREHERRLEEAKELKERLIKPHKGWHAKQIMTRDREVEKPRRISFREFLGAVWW